MSAWAALLIVAAGYVAVALLTLVVRLGLGMVQEGHCCDYLEQAMEEAAAWPALLIDWYGDRLQR